MLQEQLLLLLALVILLRMLIEVLAGAILIDHFLLVIVSEPLRRHFIYVEAFIVRVVRALDFVHACVPLAAEVLRMSCLLLSLRDLDLTYVYRLSVRHEYSLGLTLDLSCRWHVGVNNLNIDLVVCPVNIDNSRRSCIDNGLIRHDVRYRDSVGLLLLLGRVKLVLAVLGQLLMLLLLLLGAEG